MLNSNFFSKKEYSLTLNAFAIWLKQSYNIVLKSDELDKQIEFATKYISYINYKQKNISSYLTKEKSNHINNFKFNGLEKLLNEFDIDFYQKNDK